MRILVVDMCREADSLASNEFVMPIVAIVGRENCDVRHHSEVSCKVARKYSKIILSGTMLKDDEFMKDVSLFDWIRECKSPVLGICAGMEVIALVFGSKLKRCSEIGMTEVETVLSNPLFSGDFSAYALHNHGVVGSCELRVIARSGKCVQGIKHKTREIYGVMFHPEVKNKDIIEGFVSSIPQHI